MKRKSIVLIMISLLVVSILSFSFSVSAAENVKLSCLKGLKPIKIIYAHTSPDDPKQYVGAAALAFKDFVERESEGKIQVKIFPGGQLGDIQDQLELTKSGEIQISANHGSGTISMVYKNVQAITIPYLFNSVDQAMEVFRGEFGKELYEDMRQKTGLRVLALYPDGGFRCFSNNVRPIHTPSDMKGLKIRTMEVPAHMELVRLLGAKPIPISWLELYSALETNVVDGQENALPTFIHGSLYEVQKYFTFDRHVFGLQHVIMNDQWFNSLPLIYQRIILAGGQIASYRSQTISRITQDNGINFLKKKGVEVYEPTLDELALFKEATQSKVLKFVRKEVDDPKWVDKILKAVEKVK